MEAAYGRRQNMDPQSMDYLEAGRLWPVRGEGGGGQFCSTEQVFYPKPFEVF